MMPDSTMTLEQPIAAPVRLQRLVSTRFRAADLFCGAGGAAMGIHRAGFDVEGWDIKQSLSYPFRRRIGDALEADLSSFDFVWASPPCQAHSAMRHLHPEKEYECYIERTRDKLAKWGGPYIIENVPGAPLINPVQLCGSTFGLRVRRHRLFESNIPLVVPPCNHAVQGQPMDVSGTGGRRINRRPDDHGGNTNKPRNIREAQQAIGIEWMCREEIAQAIPPAFAEFLCRQVAAYLRRAQGANDQGEAQRPDGGASNANKNL
jgi:DNA (cytosine-5)-methyltransferase 1